MKHHMLVSASARILNLHIFIFIVFLKGQFCLASYEYEDCAPRNCGDVMNVTFPFYIRGLQPSYCGSHAFDCNNNGSLMFQLSGNNYSVEDIDYEGQLLQLRYSPITTCPAITNLTFGHTDIIFQVRSNWYFLVFLKNCDISKLPKNLTRYRIGSCDQLVINEYDSNLGIGMEVCTQMVVAPVEDEYYNTVVDGGNYTEVMKAGFELSWNVPDCSTCTQSGGRCGSYDYYNFKVYCFCPNSDDTLPSVGCPIEGKERNKKIIILVTGRDHNMLLQYINSGLSLLRAGTVEAFYYTLLVLSCMHNVRNNKKSTTPCFKHVFKKWFHHIALSPMIV